MFLHGQMLSFLVGAFVFPSLSSVSNLFWVPVVPHKAVAEVSKTGNL
jgi:hypothetical protein